MSKDRQRGRKDVLEVERRAKEKTNKSKRQRRGSGGQVTGVEEEE